MFKQYAQELRLDWRTVVSLEIVNMNSKLALTWQDKASLAEGAAVQKRLRDILENRLATGWCRDLSILGASKVTPDCASQE